MLENSSVPFYLQLKESLLADLKAGVYKPGDKIPTENELIEKYNVSRITVRRAITDLCELGYFTKQRAKGTFVAQHKVERKVMHEALQSFTKACESSGVKVKSEVLMTKVIKPSEHIKEMLRLADGEDVLYIMRLRLGDGTPLMLENNYYSASKFAFLKRLSLTGSLYKLLEEKYGIKPTYSPSTTVELVKANAETAKYLEVHVSEPLFKLCTVIEDQNHEVIHYGEQFIIGERYMFMI